ncbi:MAG: hypothetical protein CVU68_01755 [Deltaproteobacteria bacterium HGW-Deltaproteobacteria-3]|nr:MAG: hypothetical protein CVU68_01755 [Deltaproteobacteria bacterium HGW-Deltaproteobacteria-3]
MKPETLYFFSLPAIITGANFFITAPWNFVVRTAAGREVNPFFYFSVTLAGAALAWAGWRGWKKAKQLDLLDPDSDSLCLSRPILALRAQRLKFILIGCCVLFANAWVFPGPVMLLMTAGLVAWISRKYLLAKAELQFVRAREGAV